MIFFAPSSYKILACSFLLTMFSNGTFYFWQYLLSILPSADAAAVLIIPLGNCPLFDHFLYVSTIPTTVRGLTMPEALH